jgi:hypothetical protein
MRGGVDLQKLFAWAVIVVILGALVLTWRQR